MAVAPAILADGTALTRILFDFGAAGAIDGSTALVVEDSNSNNALQIGADGALAVGNTTLGTASPSPGTAPLRFKVLPPKNLGTNGAATFDLLADDSTYAAGDGYLQGGANLQLRTSQTWLFLQTIGSLVTPSATSLDQQPATVAVKAIATFSFHGAYDPVTRPNLGALIFSARFAHQDLDGGTIAEISAPIIFATGPRLGVDAEAFRIDYLRNFVPSRKAYVQYGSVNAGYTFGYNVGLPEAGKRIRGFYGEGIDLLGGVTAVALPTADPHVNGRLWRSGNVVMISTDTAGSFNIISLGPSLWLQGDGSAVWQDTGRTTPATLDGTAIAAMDDLSGGANHVTQATAGARPVLKVAAKNGRNAVLYDGVNDYLKATSATGLSPATITVAVVLRIDSLTNGPAFVSKDSAYNLFALSNGSVAAEHPDSLTSSAGAVANGNFYLLTFISNGSNETLYKNGVQIGTRTTPTGYLLDNANDVMIGAVAVGVEHAAMLCCEVVVIPRAITLTERTALEADLNGRWAIY